MRHRRFVLLLTLLLPTALSAQGRIIPRPCIVPPAPPCGPNIECVARPVSCGTRLIRTSNTVAITLVDRVLRYEVTEVFRNEGSTVAEADFIYPLPTGAAFEDLKLSINGELVAGETMSADKARGIYEDIVRRQRDPALVEWMGSGMLRARIFPIAPGEEKKVVVRYQSVATREGDALRVDYRRGTDPVSIGGAMPVVQPVSRRSGGEETDDTWSRVTLSYPASDNYGEPYSPTHSLRVRESGRNRVVEARGIAPDVTVLLPLRRTNEASMSVLTHATPGEDGFALITITPPAVTARAMPRDLTFVLDVSGSMLGQKLSQAKAAGEAVLATLTPSDRFRLIDFSTDVREFREGWTPATDANIRSARNYLSKLRAEGSTNISEALSTALENRTSADGRLPLVVFVTDGEPTVGERNPDAIAALAARERGDARIFTVGLTSSINAALIEQLALQGHGTAHFVRDNESVESAVGLLAQRLSQPVLTNVRVIGEGVRLTRMLPAGPIDVFAGQDLVVLARYDGSGDGTVVLEGRSPSGPVRWTQRANFRESNRSNPFVARLWAAQRIGWLAAEKRRNGRTTELDNEIRTLGERYGIPTEFSSYLVVEPGMAVAANRPMDSAVPVRRADGRTKAAGVGSGAVANQVAAAPPAADMRFEAARASAEQRAAKSVADVDAVARTDERMVDNRRFQLENGVWKDAGYRPALRTIRVKPFSPLYFELMRRIDALAHPFALGDRVVVAGRKVAIELHPSGGEAVNESAVAAVVRDW